MGGAPSLGLSGNPGLKEIPPGGGVYEQEPKPAFTTVTLGQATLMSQGEMGQRQDEARENETSIQKETEGVPASQLPAPGGPGSRQFFSD